VDTAHWVSEWPDGLSKQRDGKSVISAFNLAAPDGSDALALAAQGGAVPGVNAIYFGAWAASDRCDFRVCAGIEHLVTADITVARP
jgi:hypothetical protein